MKAPFIVGKLLNLRGLVEEDAVGNYPRWFNNEQVCHHNSHHVFPFSQSAAIEYIRHSWESAEMIVLAITDKKNDVHIGNISLQNINLINRTAEFAIIIGEEEYWGKGYAKEAAELIVRHGFMELNLNRIYCGTSIDNAPMRKLAIYLGMTQEGIRRGHIFKHGVYIDLVEFGLLKDEFILKFPQ